MFLWPRQSCSILCMRSLVQHFQGCKRSSSTIF
jgi:hypothetical protein